MFPALISRAVPKATASLVAYLMLRDAEGNRKAGRSADNHLKLYQKIYI
ncbi:MAG: hypothetical protein QNJ32_31425 [Xenococcaceae cyanobacterium MO_167.B27]|nr:hypothetical protein [Xenococcaceae cyanobacterium MO_167.B27]